MKVFPHSLEFPHPGMLSLRQFLQPPPQADVSLFSWHTAARRRPVAGLMLVSSPAYAGAAVIIVFGLAIVIHYFKPPVNAATASQAVSSTIKFRSRLLKLDVRRRSRRRRPSLLDVIDCAPRSALNLLDFCNDPSPPGGLFIVATPAVSTAAAATAPPPGTMYRAP